MNTIRRRILKAQSMHSAPWLLGNRFDEHDPKKDTERGQAIRGAVREAEWFR